MAHHWRIVYSRSPFINLQEIILKIIRLRMFRSQICSLRYCGFHQLGCQFDSGPRVSFGADSSSGHLHLPTFCNFAHILHNLCLPFPTRNKGEGYLEAVWRDIVPFCGRDINVNRKFNGNFTFQGITVGETSQLLQDRGWKNRKYSSM